MPFLDTLQTLTEKLDDYLRFRDLYGRRTVGGHLDALCGVSRHTLPALMLPVVLCALLVLASPSWRRTALAAATALVVALLLTSAMRLTQERQWPLWSDLFFQAGLVMFLAGAIWRFAPGVYSPQGIYAHLLVPLAVALAISLIVAGSLVAAMFRRMRAESRYFEYLRLTELFASRGSAPIVTFGTILTAFVIVSVRAPLALLILPALTTLLVIPVLLPWTPAAVFLLCLFALVIAGVNERFGSMWSIVLAPLVTGGASLVSGLLIVLALLRLADVTYVTTIFDTIAWGTIGATLAGAYVLSWWYDYWAERLLADQLMGMFHQGKGSAVRIDYDIDPQCVRTSVPATGRVLQIHGAGRFIALNQTAGQVFFQSLTIPDLLDLLAASGAPGGKAVPPPLQVRARVANFHTVSALVVAGLIAAAAWSSSRGRQLPEATLSRSTASLSLGTLLRRTPSATERPLILVAASGGGTRAALYTAAVLEGLAHLQRSSDIVLGSGVSGGGAALAYFAANRKSLAAATFDVAAWQQYFDVMRQPFIKDVLDRASELRMVGPGRLGMLLAASFMERWNLPPGRRTVSSVDDMGLIFNTSLAGHLDLGVPPANAPAVEVVDVEPAFRKETKSTLAGGRLILTNLQLPPGLEQTPLEPGVRIPLPVIIHSSSLRLEEAAALNANFPPVFSNAAIDVDHRFRYWVTDGGAVDNRGLEMLLFALRLSLQGLGRGDGSHLPRIHVVIADASAFSDAYSQDRGVGSAFGAGSRFASHLNAELIASIRALYGNNANRFGYSYLMMPDLLRESGSFGTHWMLQSRIRVRHDTDARTISGDEMINVLRNLHASDQGSGLTKDGCTILGWSLTDPSYRDGWLKLLETFGVSAPTNQCP